MDARKLSYHFPFLRDYKEINSVNTGLPNRHEAGNEYRYGVNGMEKDDEIHNVEGSSYDFGARIYDCRVGRFLSLDPKMLEYPFMSAYCYAANNPIGFIDIDGEGPSDPKKKLINGDRTVFSLVEVSMLIEANGGLKPPSREGDMSVSFGMVMTIVSFESLSLHLYDNDGDRHGNATIGFGHLLHHGPINNEDKALYSKGITKNQAVQFLIDDIATKSITVNNLINNRGMQGKVSQGEFDTAFDLYFNTGTKQTVKYIDKLKEISELKESGDLKKANRKSKKLDKWLFRQYPGKDEKRGVVRKMFYNGNGNGITKKSFLKEVIVKPKKK